jgi:hypothetical protein
MKNRGLVALLVILAAPIAVAAQRGGPAPPTARAASPIDLTGYWVSLVTNEWKWRMLTPQKGDYAVLPINAEARRAADMWDPARDEANGEQCRGYGAAVIMQAPGRLHITWDGDDTLKVETDAGTQTRLFRFNRTPPPAGPPAWQGHSVAQWLTARGQGRETRAAGAQRDGALRVVTTRMRPGYLRRNGVPYSGEATVTESFNRFSDRGADYFNVTVAVEDPVYLTGPYIRSMQFKKEPDGAKWSPSPCSAR